MHEIILNIYVIESGDIAAFPNASATLFDAVTIRGRLDFKGGVSDKSFP